MVCRVMIDCLQCLVMLGMMIIQYKSISNSMKAEVRQLMRNKRIGLIGDAIF